MPVKIVILNYQSLEQGEEMNLFVVEEKKGVGEEMEGRKERTERGREVYVLCQTRPLQHVIRI